MTIKSRQNKVQLSGDISETIFWKIKEMFIIIKINPLTPVLNMWSDTYGNILIKKQYLNISVKVV